MKPWFLLVALTIPPAATMFADDGGSSAAAPTKQEGADALSKLRAKAESGDTGAEFALGMIYLTGEGATPKDAIAAAKWFGKAAEGGNVHGASYLGDMYYGGIDLVPRDLGEAVKCYRKAAEIGDGYSQDRLGGIYERGDGVPRDSTEAAKWYLMAAGQGFQFSQYELAGMYRDGDGVPKDLSESAKWYRKAAEQGLFEAQEKLGHMYAYGEGVQINGAEAVRWLRKAADQGSSVAEDSLGIVYAKGISVAKDEIEGLAWFNIAAASGYTSSIQNRDSMENYLGREATLAAQQRSKEIVKEIEADKASKTKGGSSPSDSAGTQDTPKSSGSGTIVSARGLVLTAAHVVAGAAKVTVVTADGTHNASILRIDELNDVAVLKIEGGPYVPMPVESSRYVRFGQSVATIGFPNLEIQGFSPKVTRGEISSVNGVADDPRTWQISVPVQPGNSGGPLLDERGNLVGIIEAKLGLKAAQATGDIPQNVGYAVKSAYALPLLEPYLDSSAPKPRAKKQNFEDMAGSAQQSVVLILSY